MQLITGIQQIGIGVVNLHEAWKWYRKTFGMNVSVFEDEAQAKLMTRYTGGIVQTRNAALAVNMAGGGGFEIWQYKSKVPVAPDFQPVLGDLGIYAAKMKSPDVVALYQYCQSEKLGPMSPLSQSPEGKKSFFITDPYGNKFHVVQGESFFKAGNKINGGVCGAVIGVSDMEKSLRLYRDVLGIDQVVYDSTGVFQDLDADKRFRRVLLRKPMKEEGAFSRIFGYIDIELVQALDYQGRVIFENRHWGDQGFIHLCFDVVDMEALRKKCEANGFPFTVDSGSTFDMGESGGRFAYIDDPDGAWIEFVETHKIPIMKKLGWFLDLKKRGAHKPLPNWMFTVIGMNTVKD